MKISSYIQHTRPKSYIASFFLAFSGYACSPIKANTILGLLIDILLILLIYSVLLWGGTSAVNTYYDGDEDGPLNYLPNPPKVPPGLGIFGTILMALSVLVATFINMNMVILCSISLLLSFLYSGRFGKFRGKEIGVLDNAISAIGSGIIAILIGYSLQNLEFDFRVLFIGLAFTISIFGTYPCTQIHQMKKTDTYLDAKNYASLVGPSNALIIGGVCLFISLSIIIGVHIYYQHQLLGINYICSLYSIFGLLYFLGGIHLIRWAKQPFLNPDLQYQKLLKFIFLGRVSWVIGEWITWM